MKSLIKKLLPAVLFCAAPLCAHAATGAPERQELDCAAKKMQLLYYYLEPKLSDAAREYKLDCGGRMETVKIPDWLLAARPAMLKKAAWREKDEKGEKDTSEAALWQTPFSQLYELAQLEAKTLPPDGKKPQELRAEYSALQERFIMALNRLRQSRLDGSFGNRGTQLLSALNHVSEQLDKGLNAIESGDDSGFYKSASENVELANVLFDGFFAAPDKNAEHYSYRPQPRFTSGYRGMTIAVPGHQLAFLNKGDRADLLITFDAAMADGSHESVTATILQNILVLYVYRPEKMDETGYVQLLLNPDEAQYAALSEVQGKGIALARRGADDIEYKPLAMASFRRLFK